MHISFVAFHAVPIQNVKQIFSNWWHGTFRTPLKPLKEANRKAKASLQTRHNPGSVNRRSCYPT